MFVKMIDHEDGHIILINRDRIIKVTIAYNHVRLYYGDDKYYSVKHTLKEAWEILNGEKRI